ncbi:hypothetical protein, partial [Rathayibacter tritici]|uniref:hypothetical protein n=1 Tax=Rathayibacter tritici TaxID=33888 RepID=UPI001CA52BD4
AERRTHHANRENHHTRNDLNPVPQHPPQGILFPLPFLFSFNIIDIPGEQSLPPVGRGLLVRPTVRLMQNSGRASQSLGQGLVRWVCEVILHKPQ